MQGPVNTQTFLHEEDCRVVAACDLEEKTYEEAAAMLECAVGTVRSRLHRARVLLAAKLGKKKVQGCPA